MKKILKTFFIFVICSVVLFLLILATNQTPRKDNIFKRVYSSFRIQLEKTPKMFFYKKDPYYDDSYTKVESEFYDTEKQKILEVQIGSSKVFINTPSIFGQKFYSTLKPGYYMIRWRVENNKNHGQKYNTYKKRLRILRDDKRVSIKIRGNNISIR